MRERISIQRWLNLTMSGLLAAGLWASGAAEMAGHWIAREYVTMGEWFRVANTSTPFPKLLLPTMVPAVLVVGIIVLFPRGGKLPRVVVILLLIGLYTAYMAYRLFATLNLSTVGNTVASILFYLAELLIYIKAVSANFQMFWLTDRSPEATRLSEAVKSGDYLPEVDIFIPTYSEPVEILRRTVLGCQSLRYPRKNIYLLDDQRRPVMRELASELGVLYRDRPDNIDAKAGNLNAALPRSRGELIAVFDADFIPTEDFLERTVGFFSDPKVGLVQTPQNFYSVDAVSRNLGLGGIVTEEQQVFFRAAQPGRDTMGAMICHGTSFVIRREAIERVGNFPGETLSEDWATSIKLQAAGYRCYYLNELLSAGAAAEFTSEFVAQRLRWARGTLQCFYATTNPLTVPGLTLIQRIAHLCGPIHYIPYVSRLFCLLLPLLYFFFGMVPLDTTVELLMVFLLPYWICQTLSLSWLTGGHRSAFWSEVYETMLCFPMTLTVFSTLFNPFGKPFKVSKKGDTRSKLTLNPVVGIPLLFLLALYLGAIVLALTHSAWAPSPGVFVIVLVWTVYSLILIWLSLQAAMDVPQPSSSLRFKQELPATIRHGGRVLPARTVEISDTDVKLAFNDELPPNGVFAVSVPACGLHEVPVRRTTNEEGLIFEFMRLSVEQHRALIAALYCRPGQWDDSGVPERITFWHFLRAPFRMYPLAETR